MKFTKLQASGNDFVLVDARSEDRDWSSLAKIMSDRHFGIGADGLLVLLNSTRADLRMRIFNSDGSEAEACGNGLRCFTKYIYDKRLVADKAITIETMAGIRHAVVLKAGKLKSIIKVSMGQPRLRAAEIPLSVEKYPELVDITPIMDYGLPVEGLNLKLNFVSMGNPHAVCFIDNVAQFPLLKIGPLMENHALFPMRTNFEIVQLIDKGHVKARVWERGVGETMACGTGACAVAVVSNLHRYTGNDVIVNLPGGDLGVEWDGKGEVMLSGPAETIFTGVWPEEKI